VLRSKYIAVLLLCPAVLFAEAAPDCASCAPSKKAIAQARSEYKTGVRFAAKRDFESALAAFEQSRDSDPRELKYALAAESARSAAAASHLAEGNRLLQLHDPLGAQREFHLALKFDPYNSFAQQRLDDALAPVPLPRITTEDFAEEPLLSPHAGAQTFNFRGTSKQLFTEIGRRFGIDFQFDDSFHAIPQRVDLENADFFTALNIAEQLTHTFHVVMSKSQAVIAADTPENRRKLEHTSLRTFYVTQITDPKDLQELSTMLRTMLDIRFIVADAEAKAIVVRAPSRLLDATDALLNDLEASKPEVLLDIDTIQITRTYNRDLGMDLPMQFTLFNVLTEARNLLNGSGNSALLQQLIASGLNPTDAAAAAAALSAATAAGNSPLTKPFATFGGGTTLTGVNIPPATAHFDFTKSDFRTLQEITLRAQQGTPATLRIGDRFPILVASYQPLAINPLLTKALRNQIGNIQTQQPIPQFNYEDLGLTLKATPIVSSNGEITLDLDLQVKSLEGQVINSVPVISNREYKGVIRVPSGETSVLTGSISSSESRSLSGLPLLSNIPGLRGAFSTTDVSKNASDILLVITPHILRNAHPHRNGLEIYLGAGD